MAIAQVEPLTTARALRGPFDYRLPGGDGRLGVGSVARVPFGRRRLLGVVVERRRDSELPPERLAEPLEALEAARRRSWSGSASGSPREYCSTPARGLALVLPPGTGTGAAADRCGADRAARRDRPTPARRRSSGGGAPRRRSSGRCSRRCAAAASCRRRSCRAAGADRRAAPPGGPRPDRDARARGAPRARRADGRRRGGAPRAARPTSAPRSTRSSPRSTARPAPRELLLHGVTGSGKTEVYLARGRGALARGRGGDGARPGDRADAADRRALPGAVRRPRRGPALGALRRRALRRVAAAAPRRGARLRRPALGGLRADADLGLIVVDEEHDASYKQEGDPRYDARDVAERRAAERGAVLVAGSATPRARELARAAARIALPRARRRRADAAGRDPRHARASPRPGRCTRRPTRRSARSRRRRKAIVLLNRRGCVASSPAAPAGAPGVPGLRRHARPAPRAAGASPATTAATASRSRRAARTAARSTLARAGAGTERIEASWASALAPMPVFRLDADTPAARGGARRSARRASSAADRGVLVGTQMVAKGHDFPDVDARRRRRRRRDAALPGLPRRGADVRARRPARGPQRAAAPPAGGCSCRRSPRTPSRSRGAAAARRARVPRRRARAPAAAALPAVLDAGAGRLRGRGGGAPATAAARACARGSTRRCRRTSRACSGPAPLFRRCGQAPQPGRREGAPTAARAVAAIGARVDALAAAARAAAWRSAWTWTRSSRATAGVASDLCRSRRRARLEPLSDEAC